MKILINGYCGHMGREVARLAADGFCGCTAAFGADVNAPAGDPVCARDLKDARTDVDVVVDFSHHTCTAALLDFCTTHGLPLVLATTGQTPEERAMIRAAADRIPLFFAANYSVGIALLIRLAVQTAKALPDAEIEIIEQHHDRKLDAPSGTALAIADAIRTVRPDAENNLGRSGTGKRTKSEIGIHAVRMGNTVGTHEVIIGTGSQTITLKHEAHDRALFAEGALSAAAFLCDTAGGKPGLYGMEDMLGKTD
ncbi:MAG: 4-hydroxy-tetrahydrodipicolinate reductase [Clostridia bacterium]|nr:4-hydroxy-tetrahydrodipicolinate reductase [Clostridia bacterium]